MGISLSYHALDSDKIEQQNKLLKTTLRAMDAGAFNHTFSNKHNMFCKYIYIVLVNNLISTYEFYFFFFNSFLHPTWRWESEGKPLWYLADHILLDETKKFSYSVCSSFTNAQWNINSYTAHHLSFSKCKTKTAFLRRKAKYKHS